MNKKLQQHGIILSNKRKLLLISFILIIIINTICIPIFIKKSKSLSPKKLFKFKNKNKSKSKQILQKPILKPAPNHKNEFHQGLGGGFSLDDIPQVIEVPESSTTTTTTTNTEPTTIPETAEDKIEQLLQNVPNDPKHWLTNTELTNHKIQIKKDEFLKENWINKPAIFYDPRFTLSLYLSDIKNQYLTKNPTNDISKKHEIVIPFAWQDWVDLTMLNQELIKPHKKRKNCEYMKSFHHIPTKIQDYCINNFDIMKDDLDLMNLSSIDFVPGFAVKKSPTNKASNEVRMLEGKSHLLTYASNPLSIIFLSENGTYEAQIDGKQRIVDGSLFENYLSREGKIDDEIIELDPVKEFNNLVSDVNPEPSINKIQPTEIYLPESSFDYQQDKIDFQIKEFEKRINKMNSLIHNELNFDLSEINNLKLTRFEKQYYDGLKITKKINNNNKKEHTYFRMARLNFGNSENDHDAGWHYEWRFFNGALRFLKSGWSIEELQIRESILLDRILRNWFKFSQQKGIISWIAHGPLLAWYWNSLLFPFDEDIDIQMPANELIKFCKTYNQTLVVEDINEGYGKYFIDCSTFIHHRSKSYKENHIDARFIDIDTGSYIDITGLGVSNEILPSRYDSILEQNFLQGKTSTIYNCRFPHFYSFEEISPLRLTKLGDIPVYIPNNLEEILKMEYGEKGLKNYSYGGFIFVDKLNLWIEESKLKFLKSSLEDSMIDIVQNLSEDEILEILIRNPDILSEYYITHNATNFHKQELEMMFNLPNGTQTNMKDIGSMFSKDEISLNNDYHQLLQSNTKFNKPLRKSIFNYEKFDRILHHND
ncbi:uncharacterized protein KGF55_004588 [Candida pseudojiufengensis]|uniref:uncharacterized protein n=1 Tax=Candida pseudojiufengensis TaxID=497109 RepID=UPI002225A3DF|nr:uncharacterized protein KGF55_004588 [Candida pseudojiufengensis]KAI5960296.1 hypothetical protein KGF55_004588 [Candida pseudojiufengensis]